MLSRRGVRGVLAFVAVLIGLVALWEGYRAIGQAIGLTWPFPVNERSMPAAAMTYNELAQVLETKNPKTGKLYQLSDLNVIKLADVGTGMLEDGIFVRGDWIADEASQDIATRFLKASFKGWAYCRDSFDSCLSTVLDNGPTLGEGHQRWQLNEINALIWPAPAGVGVMDADLFGITADIALKYAVISKAASSDAYRTDLAEAAVQQLQDEGDVDVNGADYQKLKVEVTPGGE